MMNKGITSCQPKGFLRFLFRLPLWLYRVKLGWILGKRFLMLTHIGRKSGQLRQVVLEVVHHDTDTSMYFVAAGWRGKADWFKNIQLNPAVQVTVGTRTFEAEAVVMQLVEAAATFYIYAHRHPLAFRELSRLMMGEMLQPDQEDCFRLAQSVPLVKISPHCFSDEKIIKTARKKPMTELWLVRHGQTDWNLTGRWQGQSSDAPGLNDTGHAQALNIHKQLKGGNISAIYSSDLLRARQTADLIAEPLELLITLELRLREINLGAWEGMPSVEIEAKYPQELAERAQNPFHTRALNGESPCDVAERVLMAINEIANKHPGESVLIVAHGISLAVIICHSEGFPMEDIYQHIPDNAHPHRVHWTQ